MYRKCLQPYIKVVETHESRITAVIFQSNIGPVLLMCVYMPTDYGDVESAESYVDVCVQRFQLFMLIVMLCMLLMWVILTVIPVVVFMNSSRIWQSRTVLFSVTSVVSPSMTLLLFVMMRVLQHRGLITVCVLVRLTNL